MSAWLCENGTLSLVVDVIKSDSFKEYDVENYADKNNKELVDILSDLNTKSLNCRYGKSEDNILQNREYINLNVEDGQKYKSVCCYLYQTCECLDIVEHPLFSALDEWRMNNRQYEDYKGLYHWDIDRMVGLC